MSTSGELQPVGTDLRAVQRQLAALRKGFDSFTYSVSHDMKGPLHTMKGFLEIVIEDYEAGRHQTLREDLQRIQAASEQLQAQLECILQVSRLGRRSLTVAPLDVVAFMQACTPRMAGRVSQAGGTFDVHCQTHVVWADPAALEEILGHLTDNAVQYRSKDRPLCVDVSFIPHDGGARLVFEDNGRGVDGPQLEAIFVMFRKLDPHSPGMGVGLTYVQWLMSLMGGFVHAEQGRGGAGLRMIADFPLPTSNLRT